MDWTPEAEDAIKKVPFFVRKRVRARVEKEAREAGNKTVSLVDVKATQARYLKSMASEVKGYQVETCFGPSGCPNRAVTSDRLLAQIESLMAKEDISGFLKARVAGELKFHHEFRVTLADCPNACSQPQIKDIGIIGACHPRITAAECTDCGACGEACPEAAVSMDETTPGPLISEQCIACGKCVAACPTGTLATGRTGYRVQLGGKLGRHPRLAAELPDIYDADTVLTIIRDCIALYKSRSRNGRRFAELLTAADIEHYVRQGRFPEVDTVDRR